MLIDQYLNDIFHYRPRIPSRLVRYGIVYSSAAKDSLQDFEPRFDPMMKAQAELMVERLQAFIQCCEDYENRTVDGPTEEDDEQAAR